MNDARKDACTEGVLPGIEVADGMDAPCPPEGGDASSLIRPGAGDLSPPGGMAPVRMKGAGLDGRQLAAEPGVVFRANRIERARQRQDDEWHGLAISFRAGKDDRARGNP